jgi:hypothetical protein
MTEEQLEQETLGWLADVGYISVYGPDIVLDGSTLVGVCGMCRGTRRIKSRKMRLVSRHILQTLFFNGNYFSPNP